MGRAGSGGASPTQRALGLAGYRVRATLRHRWAGYLTIVLLIGLVGGLSMGAVAGARRTQSSFSAYLAGTNASDLTTGVYPRGGSFPSVTSPYYRRFARALAHLPLVTREASYSDLLVAPLKPDGAPFFPEALNDDEVETIGSANGLYFDQDRVAVSQGRLPAPGRADQIVATAEAARLLGWHVGQVIPVGAYTVAQSSLPAFGTAQVKPYVRLSVTLTGIVVFQSEIVRDDVDRFPTLVLFTPAFTERVAKAAVFPTYALRLKHGERDVPTVEREIIGVVPRGSTYTFHLTSVAQGQVQRAIKPESIALGIFGAIAGLAALLIAGQAIGRALRSNGGDLEVLRALGAPPSMTAADGLLPVLGSVLLGSLAAVGVAAAISPLAPIGPVRQVDPQPGFAFDWTVLIVGFVGLVVLLGALATALTLWGAPHRRAARRGQAPSPRGSVAGAAARAGLSASAVIGIRFALERGRDRVTAPVRSALLGAVLAIAVVVATLTFASGLSTLVSNPSLYGWNWSYAIEQVGGGQVPPQTDALLKHDPDVAAWSGFNFGNAEIDDQTVPILLQAANAPVGPPILSGHRVEANDQIVLGAATLAQLHKKVGDTVVASYGSAKNAPVYVPPTKLLIVGTATLPAIGNSGALHASMGTGAVLSVGIEPAAMQKALLNPDPNLNGPPFVAVRLRSGVSAKAGLASLRRIASESTKAVSSDPNDEGTFQVLAVQRPAEIVNYRSTGATPGVLASGLAVAAVVALGLTLMSSVRRRRRELALLKTLGFTERQLAATVSWQASVAAVVGVVVGVPLGIALGRWLWILFAHEIYAVSDPTVPVLQIVLVAVAALVLANVVAALPGRAAARIPTAVLLRAE